jgi:hypothetical protein
MRLAAASLLAALLAAPVFALAQTTAPAPGVRPAAPLAATPAPAPTTTPATPAPIARRGTTAAATAAGSADEATAKQKCGADQVVWGNPSSKVYHTSASRYFGKTKKGSFMCQKDADAAGFHASKSSTPRAKKPATS